MYVGKVLDQKPDYHLEWPYFVRTQSLEHTQESYNLITSLYHGPVVLTKVVTKINRKNFIAFIPSG